MSASLPRIQSIGARRAATLGVIDIGTSKAVCLVVRLEPLGDASADTPGRHSHAVRVLGIGVSPMRGLKGGAVVDLDLVGHAVRDAVEAAERMARVEVRSVTLGVTGGRLRSRRLAGSVPAAGRIEERDARRACARALREASRPGRGVLHASPVSYTVDGVAGIAEPVGMVGSELGVELHVATADTTAARNLMLAVERCHLGVDALVATPFASALAVLTHEEIELGALLIDLGAGTTSLAAFAGGRLVHLDAVALGGRHVTLDLARGLSLRFADAEALKLSCGGLFVTPGDEHETVEIPRVDEDGQDAPVRVPRAQIVRIIRPRVEEILEALRDRLDEAGMRRDPARPVVLTGGASRLPGLAELGKRVLGRRVRLARPDSGESPFTGVPEAAGGPEFSVALGLALAPTVAGAEVNVSGEGGLLADEAGRRFGAIGRMGHWLRTGF